MSPLALVGILVIASSAVADVKHVLEGSAHPPEPNSISPQAVNYLASNPPNGQYWWMNSNSPLKAAYDYYKKCNDKSNCLTPVNPNAPPPQPFRPHDTVNIDIKKNPFFNGNFNPQGGNSNYNNGGSKLDISKNPFLSGTVVATGNGAPVVKDQDGFLGVQPAQPFSKKPGFATTHPLEQKKKPGFATTHPLDQQKKPCTNKNLLNITVECRGAGFACVEKSLCVNGVVNQNGEGLLQVRSDVRYCHEDTELCCQLNNLNEITAGKSSVPGSTIKFAGGAGFSPGLIHVQPLDVKPDISFGGEHGHHSGATSKSVRDTSSSPNSVFSSTVDYSDTKFDDDIRFASTFQGPAYLPPVGPSSPAPKPFETQQPSINQQYFPSRSSTPTYVEPSPTTPRPTPPTFRPNPPVTYRPVPSTDTPVTSTPFRPAPPVTFRPAPPVTFRPAPPVTFRPAPSTSREYLPPRSSTPGPSSTVTQYVPPQQPYQPSVTPQRPYQPSITPQRPYQPTITPQQPYQPTVTPQKPYQPSITTQQPYRPSVTPQQPYQPSVTPQKPYQPSITTQQPYRPSITPYQPSVTPQKPYQPSITTQQPYRPSITPYQPSVTPQKPYQPSITTQQPYRPSITPYQPIVTPQKPYQPNVTPIQPYRPQQPYQPTVTPQQPYQPTVTPQKPYQPSITPQQPYQPTVTPQKPYQPSITSQQPYQPTVTPQKPYQPSITPQQPYQPSITPQQPYQPSVTPQRPYQPTTIRPYQPQQTTSRPYQPYQPSTTSREYLPPRTASPFVPQPSSPRPNPFIPQQTTPRPTYQPQPGPSVSQPSVQYPTATFPQPKPTISSRYPTPTFSQPQPTPSPQYPVPTFTQPKPTPRPQYPSPSQPSEQPTNGYQYPTPAQTRPTPPPFRPTASIPQFPQPRPTLPPVTNGYQYPSSSSPRPTPFIPQESTPSRFSNPEYVRPSTNYIQPSTPSRPAPTPYQPSTQRPFVPQQTTAAPNPAGGYEYPKPTPTFGYPSPTPRPVFGNSNVNNQYVPPPRKPGDNPDQSYEAANVDGVLVRPTTPRIPFQGELNTAPPSGCAAALKCVQEIYCSADGVISPVPVVLTKEQELSKVPTTVCQDTESGIIGKCCRDPNYVDPWPSANLVNGVDDGQYKEDDNLGQYQQDLQRNVRSDKGGPRQDFSNNRNTNIQPKPQPTCGDRHLNSNPPGPGPLDVDFAEIPWQAMVLRDTNRSLLCGGAIIRRDAILTAAHCVEGLETSDILVKGGEWKLGIDEEPLPFQIVKVAVVVRHPQYQKGSFVNDLALLVLEEKLRPSKNIGTLCLPAPNQIPTQNCIATGWGKRILQLHAKGAIMHSIDVKIMDNQQCQETLAGTFQHASSNYSPNTLCGYSNIDQCKVDYGSALACSDGNQYTLSGIYAWDTGCKQEGQIGGYIAPDVEWIESTLAKPIRELKKLE